MISRTIFVGYGWASVIVHAVICAITVPSALVVTNLKTEEGQYILQVIKRIVRRRHKSTK